MNASNATKGLRGFIATGIFVVLALSPGLVSAADPSSASRTVRLADLNLSNPSDARVLYRRILAAAQVVCSYVPFATDADKARCEHDVTADAVTRIHQPELSAVYNAKNKTPVSSNLASRSR